METKQEARTKLNQAIKLASAAFNLATGFSEYERKKLAAYAIMTHYIKDFDPFPQLAIAGTPGTGKSSALNILKGICYKVVSVTGETITDAALRAAMKEAEYGTLIIEEADNATERSLENTLVTRYSRASASNTKMVSDGQNWVLEKQGTFGATIFHRRNLFRDPALLRRLIVLRTRRKKGNYISVTPESHPELFRYFRQQLGFRPTWPEVNNSNDVEQAILDCYRPLLALAALIEDQMLMGELEKEMLEASNRLVEEEGYLEAQVLLKALITLSAEKVRDNVTEKLINIEVSRIDPVIKNEYGFSCPVLKLSANQRNRIIREDLGFPIRSSHGRNRVYLSIPMLIEVCEANGVEDDCLTQWKVALGMIKEPIQGNELEEINEKSDSDWETEE
jgi:hypothetical protein